MSVAPAGRLSIITYNVWFDEYAWEARFDALLSLLAASSADCICLQEVTRRFEARLLSAPPPGGTPLTTTALPSSPAPMAPPPSSAPPSPLPFPASRCPAKWAATCCS